MTILFKRYVSLVVGKPGFFGDEIKDLRIEFEIEKTTESNANKGKIIVYNLSPYLQSAWKDEGQEYELSAGYYGLEDIPLIGVLSSGDITDITTVRNGPDFITTLKVQEGAAALDKTLDKSFNEGVSVKTIVDSKAKGLDVAKGAIKGLKDIVFNSGYSASGKIKDRLDELLGKQGLEWSIQNGELQILPEGEATNEFAVNLTSETGLLKAFMEKSKVNGGKQLVDLLKFEALLNPEIKIGRTIQVTTKRGDIDGALFKVRKVRYNGSNKDGLFQCVGEATPL